jgi:hypothetical protein
METPAESKPKADAARTVCPEVQRFIERVVVPALVKRYIRELQEESDQPQQARSGSRRPSRSTCDGAVQPCWCNN